MILIILGYTALIAYELPILIKYKLIKEMIVFFTLLAISLAITIILIVAPDLPSPVQLIKTFFEKVGLSYKSE